MSSTRVPETYEQLVEQHSALVRWTVSNILRGRVSTQDINDVIQDVYVRVLEKDYLSRCRAYAATVDTYHFSTSLVAIARNVAISALRSQDVRGKYAGPSLTDYVYQDGSAGPSAFDSDKGAAAAQVVSQTAAKIRLDALRRHVDGIPFGTATVGALIDTVLANDGLQAEDVKPFGIQVKYARRRIREVVLQAAAATEATA